MSAVHNWPVLLAAHATVISIREALDFSTDRAIRAAGVGLLAQGLVLTITYKLSASAVICDCNLFRD